MNKLFISQNKMGGGSFQYKSIEVYVNDFGAQRTEGRKRRD